MGYELGERGFGVCEGGDAALALAVIAEAGGLEDGRGAERSQSGGEIGETGNGAMRGDGNAEFCDEGLFRETVLRDGERIGAGAQGFSAREEFGGGGGDV